MVGALMGLLPPVATIVGGDHAIELIAAELARVRLFVDPLG
jgi:hypothetical protein